MEAVILTQVVLILVLLLCDYLFDIPFHLSRFVAIAIGLQLGRYLVRRHNQKQSDA